MRMIIARIFGVNASSRSRVIPGVGVGRPSFRSSAAATKQGQRFDSACDPLVATRGAYDAGGLNAVVTVGSEALLFLWCGYADPAPRASPPPRFDATRGISAESGPALLVATSRGGRRSRRPRRAYASHERRRRAAAIAPALFTRRQAAPRG